MPPPLRIGVLGAARITPNALLKPARDLPGVEVAAVAARDPARAARFAAQHGIRRVHADYAALLDDDGLDAVYIPLPNGLHAHWTLAALDAGKHVLCEKPFTANADEATTVLEAAAGSGLVVMEAFHWRYHPLAKRMLDIIDNDAIGALRHVSAAMCFPLPRWSDIRWQRELAGGSLMDAGCYAVHIVRTLAGREPVVTAATARVRTPEVDRWVRAELDFGTGVRGRVVAAMWSARLLQMSARVVGERGTLHVLNPVAPHVFHLLAVRRGGRVQVHRVRGRSTYYYQLAAFAAAVREGAPVLTPPADAVANMRVIDEIYRAAGLAPR